jgi:hypothetical protein
VVLPLVSWGLLFAASVLCRRIPVVVQQPLRPF